MKEFADLFAALDQTNKTNDKINLLVEYFARVDDNDKLWTIALFSGRKPKRPVNTTIIRNWAIEMSSLQPWLFEECYHVVGDLAEAISLCLPPAKEISGKTLTEWILFIESLSLLPDEDKRLGIEGAWRSLTAQQRFVFNKILTGSFRVGVSQSLIVAALSKFTGLEKNIISHRLMGNWSPANTSYKQLLFEENDLEDASRPYPFFLAYALETQLQDLGSPVEWQIEWKWDGIRSQLIRRKSSTFLWSRGEELVTDKFPEISLVGDRLPEGTVLDGEILPFKDGKPLPFAVLQTRIGRKNLTAKYLSEAPVALIVYDIMEWKGEDIREWPISERRALVERVVSEIQLPACKVSELVEFTTWEGLASKRVESRERMAEGFMLKRKSSTYQVGRRRGDWYKWKIEPLTIDAVLIYAQKGHGRRADLYTDYTFGVWEEGKLVPFAKAYSGLTDEEIKKVDYFIRRNTKEKFGPVRTVAPQLVFEVAFEGIQKSSRHKCGIAVRFPRILRWRHDKLPQEANSLQDLKSLLDIYSTTGATDPGSE